jgi:hypothetical protein
VKLAGGVGSKVASHQFPYRQQLCFNELKKNNNNKDESLSLEGQFKRKVYLLMWVVEIGVLVTITFSCRTACKSFT